MFNIKGCQNKREGLQNYGTLVYGRECQNNGGGGEYGNSKESNRKQFNKSSSSV